MSNSIDLIKCVNEIKFLEQNYKWDRSVNLSVKLVEYYKQNNEYRKIVEVKEKIVYYLVRLAYQQNFKSKFQKYIRQALTHNDDIVTIYENKIQSQPTENLKNKAKQHYLEHLLTNDSSERIILLDKSLEKGLEALGNIDESTEKEAYGELIYTYLTYLLVKAEFTLNWEEQKKIIEHALMIGESSIDNLSNTNHTLLLAKIYCILAYFLPDRTLDVFESIKKQQELTQKGYDYAKKAVELAEKHDDHHLKGRAYGIFGYMTLEHLGDERSAKEYAEKQLKIGLECKDSLLLGLSNELLSYIYVGEISLIEDKDEIIKNLEKAFSYAKTAQKYFKIISKPHVIAYMMQVESFGFTASVDFSIQQIKKINQEGISVGKKLIDDALESGDLLGAYYLKMEIITLYASLLRIENNEKNVKQLLSEINVYTNELIDLVDQIQPYRYWSKAVYHHYTARFKKEQAKYEHDKTKKKILLLDAIREIEHSIKAAKTDLEVYPFDSYFSNYSLALLIFGDIYYDIYQITGEKQYVDEAIKISKEALQIQEKLKLDSRVGELHWKIAKYHDELGDHDLAAIEFKNASDSYKNAALKHPNIQDFFLKYSKYLDIWKNIEQAKESQKKGEYKLVQKLYQEVASSFLETKWSYLTPNYNAWGKLNESEYSSRNDDNEKAIQGFQAAQTLFGKAKKMIEKQLEFIDEIEEKDLANELIHASDTRIQYCKGRIELEEAKILDKKGEYSSSSRKYGTAGLTFQKIFDTVAKEADRKEIKPIISLCKAWEKTKQAEARASPKLYLEAAFLFDEAKENSQNEKTRLLALGHSSLCRALEAGTRYEETKGEYLHNELIRHLSSASTYYLKAGFDSALEYSKGTQRLFEAFMYMDTAAVERDPVKKAGYYNIAESVLLASIESYKKANHTKKSDEIYRLLTNVREEGEFAQSLGELMHAPDLSSSTISFAAPIPSYERAVGLERFKHASVEVSQFIKSEEVSSGETFEVVIELFNPGQASASLLSIENIFSQSFQVMEVSGVYRLDNDRIDLRGRKLPPLDTREVIIKVRSLGKGEFDFKPSIFFVNDVGETMKSEPESLLLQVSEMGIMRWIRG